jgi:hypothetical protein
MYTHVCWYSVVLDCGFSEDALYLRFLSVNWPENWGCGFYPGAFCTLENTVLNNDQNQQCSLWASFFLANYELVIIQYNNNSLSWRTWSIKSHYLPNYHGSSLVVHVLPTLFCVFGDLASRIPGARRMGVGWIEGLFTMATINLLVAKKRYPIWGKMYMTPPQLYYRCSTP